MLAERGRVLPWLALVFATMAVLFAVPAGYFVAATFVATGCMLVSARRLGALGKPGRVRTGSVAVGLGTAAVLYLVFFLGGAFVDAFHPLGVTSASESTIYSLISSPSNPIYLQVAVLLFDSAGYEAFFRGVLQQRLQARFGAGAALIVALLDSGLHVITLNPIWVGGTFVTDLVWGLTYYRGKGLQSSFTSHFLWDLAIFIVRPIT
jgi:membrane protease YdiL (CAAX protease family)